MLGLKQAGPIGRTAAAWLLASPVLALGACASGSAASPNLGAGGSGSGGTGTMSGAAGTSVTPPGSAPQVGLVTLRRLNRTEYGNTLHDLIGTATDYSTKYPAENLPMGDHAGGIGSFATNRTVVYTSQKMGGASIDQVVADQVGTKTKLKSIELSGEEGFSDGTCDSGYPCAIGNHIAFDASGTPLPKLFDTAAIFDRLFMGFDAGASAADAARRAKYRKSVLDNVLGQATKLSATDKVKLDEYLNAVRDVESRIDVGGASASCKPPTRTEGTLDDATRHGVLADLIGLAFQCNVTSVASLMWGNMTSNRNYAFIGASGGHHDISHHGMDADKISKLKIIGKWEMDQIAAMLTKFKSLPDSDGRTVLDNTLVFISSDISDGDAHNHDDRPVLLAGGGAGFSMGRHVEYPDMPHFGQLFLSIANAFGSPVTSFGEHGMAGLSGLV